MSLIWTRICAFDPGLTGAIALYYPDDDTFGSILDMPVAGHEIDAASIAELLRASAPVAAVIETQSARPGQGVSSSFKIGDGYGILRGVVATLGIPLHRVSPAKWKHHFGLDADKEKSRAMALRLWPAMASKFNRKKDHGRAEAALLARWFAETRGISQKAA